MKKLIYIAIIVFISINVNAQIDTISGSRLNWSVIRGIINSNFAYEEERIDSVPDIIDTEIQNFSDTLTRGGSSITGNQIIDSIDAVLGDSTLWRLEENADSVAASEYKVVRVHSLDNPAYFEYDTLVDASITKVDSSIISDTALYIKKYFEIANRTIYIDPTGNDLTGTGLIGAPFATLLRAMQDIKSFIDQNIDITIHANAGSYTYVTFDMEKEFQRIARFDNASIIIESDMTLIESGLTLTPRSPEAYIYDVTGATFTKNEVQDMFLLDGSEYHPIVKNDPTVIYALPGASPATSIYEPSATFTLDAGLFNIGGTYSEGGTQEVLFNHVKISYASNIIPQWSSQVRIFESSIYTSGFQLEYRTKVTWSFERVNFITTGTSYGITYKSTPGCSFKECALRKTASTGGSGILMPTLSTSTINGVYIYNYDEGFSQSTGTTVFEFAKANIVLDSCTTGFIIENSSHISLFRKSVKLYLDDVDYLLGQRNTSNEMMGDYSFQVYDISGTPSVDWLDANLAVNGYINPSKGISIILPNIPDVVTYSFDILSPLNNDSIVIDTSVTVDGYLRINGAIKTPFETESFSVSKTIDYSTGSFKDISLTNDLTLNVSNLNYGVNTLKINQDATGRTITIGTGWGTAFDNTATLSTTADVVYIIQFIYDGTDTFYGILTIGE